VDYIELDCTVIPRDPFADVLMAELAGIGFDMFEEHEDGIRAYIGAPSFEKLRLLEIPYFSENEFCNVTWTTRIIEHRNWNLEWESNFEPVVIAGKILVRAAFHPSQPGFEHEIVIQPKMSFGTGHHDTTSLVMTRMLQLDFKNKKVLDMGCGSGILAILAGMLGASTIWAVDNDAIATENAIENCNINGFSNVVVKTGSSELIRQEKFDIVIANINRNILLEQMNAFSGSIVTEGLLILSGFYEDDIAMLVKDAEKNGFIFSSRSTSNKWCELIFTKKQAAV
jgi:ribosomal protein L11 methyltransferase